MTDAIITFVRKPELGKVKTRLAAEVGQEKALEIYTKLLHHTKDVISPLACHQYIFTTEKQQDNFWKPFFIELQTGNDLGERMQQAFTLLFNKGYQRIIIIGSDCPSLTTAMIRKAFDTLGQNDIVIGPANDGGYYLLGMKRIHTPIFKNKSWSTATVFSDTLKDINTLQLKYYLLGILSDIDEVQDVPADWL